MRPAVLIPAAGPLIVSGSRIVSGPLMFVWSVFLAASVSAQAVVEEARQAEVVEMVDSADSKPAISKPAISKPADLPSRDRSTTRGRLIGDIEFLASEELRGRGVDDESIDLAAEYLADQMTIAGFAADAVDGGPFQPVSINLGTRPGPASQNYARFTLPSTSETFLTAELDDGFMPLAIGSRRGTVSGPLAFVGYGIQAETLGYDDYQSIDVRGCVVMMIRKTPGFGNKASVFGADAAARHALFSRKIELAIQSGASAVLLVNDPRSTAAMVANVEGKRDLEIERIESIQSQIAALPAEAEQTRAKLQTKIEAIRQSLADTESQIAAAGRGILGVQDAGKRRDQSPSIPVVSIGRDVADRLIAQADGDRTLESLEASIDRIDADRRHQSASFFVPSVRCKVEVSLTPSQRTSPNVIGVIDGRGNLATQSVIIGAHYDHVGMGGYGSLAPGTIAVHNGADDNASGTAAMLEIGRLLKSRLEGAPNRRRILLIGFTGEERGLLGSQYFVRHPRVNLSTVQTMINLDMVGRLRDDELTVYGTGSGSMLDGILEQINKEPSAKKDPGSPRFRLSKVATGYGPSDHQSFYVAGVPVLFFFTGLHNDYHRPSDDVDKLSIDGLVRIVEMVSDVTERLATMPQRVDHIAVEQSKQPLVIRRQLTVRLGITMSPASSGGPASGVEASGVEVSGVEVSGVANGSAAEAAGIQIGDLILRLDKIDVSSPQELIEALRRYKPGDQVAVMIRRKGADQTFPVTLKKR